MTARFSVLWGSVVARELRLACELGEKIVVKLGSKDIPFIARGRREGITIKFEKPVEIKEGRSLVITID